MGEGDNMGKVEDRLGIRQLSRSDIQDMLGDVKINIEHYKVENKTIWDGIFISKEVIKQNIGVVDLEELREELIWEYEDLIKDMLEWEDVGKVEENGEIYTPEYVCSMGEVREDGIYYDVELRYY